MTGAMAKKYFSSKQGNNDGEVDAITIRNIMKSKSKKKNLPVQKLKKITVEREIFSTRLIKKFLT